MGPCSVCGSSNCELFCTAFDRFLGKRDPLWEIRRCRSCGFGWTFPPLEPEQIGDHYPAHYTGEVEATVRAFLSGRLLGSRSWRKETEKVRLVERFIPAGRILDVGCGDGKFLWALEPRRWDRHGVERNARVVDYVSSSIAGIRLVAGGVFSRELAPASFDVITFWHVLEHLPDPRRILKRLVQLLVPGGWVVISLPNLASLQARIFRHYWYAFDDVPRHLYHFSPPSLDLLLREAGFQVQKHLFFSPTVNIHSLKYSLINWSEETFHTRLPYYLLKPLLFAFQLVERTSGRYGMLTTVARLTRS